MIEPIKGYKILRFSQSFARAIFTTYFMIYQIDKAKFGAMELVLVETALALGILLFDVPTGTFADLVSRKFSVLLGFLLVGISFLVMGFTTIFGVYFAAALVWGIGETFISGAREAWAAEEIPYSAQPDLSPASLFLKGSQADFLGGLLGITLSAFLAWIDLSLPLLVSGFSFLVLAAAGFFLFSEKGFNRVTRSGAGFAEAWRSYRSGWGLVTGSGAMIALMVLTVSYGMSSKGFDGLAKLHIIQGDGLGLPSLGPLPDTFWWAFLAAGVMLLAWATTALVQSKVNLNDEKAIVKVLTLMTFSIPIGLAVFAFAQNIWVALGAFLFCRTIRKANSPLMTGWLAIHAPKEVKATILSFEGQTHALGGIVGGPMAGGIAELFNSVRLGILSCIVLIAPGALLLTFGLSSSARARKQNCG